MAKRKGKKTNIGEIAVGLFKILIAGSVVLGIVSVFLGWYKTLSSDIKDYWVGTLTLIVGGIGFFLIAKHYPKTLSWINKTIKLPWG